MLKTPQNRLSQLVTKFSRLLSKTSQPFSKLSQKFSEPLQNERGGFKLTLTSAIIIAMVVGITLGLIFNFILNGGALSPESVTWIKSNIIDGVFGTGAAIFIRTLKMLVVPLVFVSIVCGTSSLGDPKKLGRVGGRTLGLYMMTTAVAISIALMMASLFNVGMGEGQALSEAVDYQAKTGKPFSQVIIDIFPANPINAMANGIMLQVIFFAGLFGLSLALVGEKAGPVSKFFTATNEVVMKMVTILMAFAPIGVFCVITKVFANEGFEPIGKLLTYFLVVLGVLAIHGLGVYTMMLRTLGKLNPFQFLKNIRPAAVMAFSTASSNATIPVTLETVEKNMGVDNSVASFTVPLGATINMDGTAIMQGVATVFIANAAGIDLTMTQFLMVILTATFASVGTAGVPGVGMVTLAMVLQQAGLPESGILMLLPVDRILDMCRTAVNICGDAAVTCIVAQKEGQLDEKVFNASNTWENEIAKTAESAGS